MFPDVPKVTEASMVGLFKIDMETGKQPHRVVSTDREQNLPWHYYDGLYTKHQFARETTRTWATKTVAEKDSNGRFLQSIRRCLPE